MCIFDDSPSCLYDTIDCAGNCCEEGRLMFDRYLEEKHEEEKVNMENFRQVSAKISGYDQSEIDEKIKKLGASHEMPILIKEIESESIDKKKWFIVNFFIKTTYQKNIT